MKHPRHRPPRHARGFSLLEVLVSIVVLSFGVLGMVGMQAAALQANRDARLQSAGVRLAREAAELIRDNKAIAQASLTSATDNPYLVAYTSPTVIPAVTQNCFTSTCTTAKNIADYGIKEWLGRAYAELPGARIAVCYDTAPYDAAGLPRWACTNTGAVMIVKLGWTRSTTNRADTGTSALDTATRPAIMMPVTAGAAV